MSEERSTVSICVDSDLAHAAARFTPDFNRTTKDLLTGFIARNEAPQRLEGAALIRLLDAVNAFHEAHGLLSDEFPML